MSSTDDFVLIDHPRPDIALVTLNRPERMNAMAFDVMVPLAEALRDVNNDNDVRAVVVTGAGHGFCSGADLVSSGRVPYIDGLTPSTIAHRAADRLHEVIELIGDLHQPVIAAINGAAIGGGMCLALACDIRIASTEAYFRAAGINNGLTAAELGLSFTLPRAIGSSRAFEIMLTGRDVDAEEADGASEHRPRQRDGGAGRAAGALLRDRHRHRRLQPPRYRANKADAAGPALEASILATPLGQTPMHLAQRG